MADRRAAVYHNLSVMLAAGVPLGRSLRSSADGATGRLQNALQSVMGALDGGDRLAEAMGRRPDGFAPLDVLLVKVGEVSGRLPESLELLSQWYSFRARLRGTITAGLMMPLGIFHIAALVAPLPSLFLGQLDGTEYVLNVVWNLAWCYVPAAVILAVVKLTPATGPCRRLLDGLVVWVPFLGRAVRQLALSRFCRAFHAIHRAGGIDLVSSVEMALSVTGNAAVRAWLDGGLRSVREGNRVSDGFAASLPEEFVQTWQAGEETGTLEKATLRLADSTAAEAEAIFVQLAKWLPRFIYLLVVIRMALAALAGLSAIGSALSAY